MCPACGILPFMRGRTAVIFSILAFLTMLLASCGSRGGGGRVSENRSSRGYNPGVGPFDSRGNYVERWANDKSKGVWWRRGSTSGPSAATPPVVASNVTPRPAVQPTGTRPAPPVGGTATPTPRPRPAVASRPTPRPRPTVKVKPKRKPPIRYTVKKGDTLWGISQKYKASVTSIQRANGLKGTHLKIGRRLLIPRY